MKWEEILEMFHNKTIIRGQEEIKERRALKE